MPAARPPRKPMAVSYVGWVGVFLLFGLLALAIWLFTAPKTITYDQLLKLAKAGRIQKASFIGNERMEAELKADALDSKEAKEARLTHRSFQAHLIPAHNEKLTEILVNAGVEIEPRDDPLAWLGPSVLIIVCIIVFAVIFFLFLFPRMRDNIGGHFRFDCFDVFFKRFFRLLF